MKDPHSPEWHEKRRQGIGGSEWHHVLGLEPYGCARYLWYRKRDTEPDFPFPYTGAMKRGQKLEQLVAEEVTDLYDFKITKPGKLKADRLANWWIGNLDRRIPSGEVEGKVGPGVSEFKTKGPFPFMALKRDGINDTEKLQCQHYMGLTGWKWALYACLEPVNWELFVQFIDRDDESIELMRKAGERFWREVTEGPAPYRLMASDKRCQSCSYRWTCHGEGLLTAASIDDEDAEEIEDPYLSGLIDKKDMIKVQKTTIKEMDDEVNAAIKEHLGSYRKVVCSSRPVIWKLGERTTLKTEELKKEEPKIFKKYSVTKPSEYFRVF